MDYWKSESIFQPPHYDPPQVSSPHHHRRCLCSLRPGTLGVQTLDHSRAARARNRASRFSETGRATPGSAKRGADRKRTAPHSEGSRSRPARKRPRRAHPRLQPPTSPSGDQPLWSAPPAPLLPPVLPHKTTTTTLFTPRSMLTAIGWIPLTTASSGNPA